MSLVIDSSKIYIQNASGTTKFSSDNGLLYRTGYKTGSLTVSNYNLINHGLSYNPSTDLALGTYKVTACGGNVASSFVGNNFPMSVPLLLHVESVTGTRGLGDLATRPTYLSFAVGADYLLINNKKIHTSYDDGTFSDNTGYAPVSPDVSISITYSLSIYRKTF